MHKKINTTISFYKFTKISDLDNIRYKIYTYLKKLDVYGTVILASEGINANFCGTSQRVESSRVFISKLLSLGSIHYNKSNIKERVFTKLKVKIKD